MVWGRGPAGRARAYQRDGSEVVAWPGADPEILVRAGVTVRPIEAAIGDEGLTAAAAGGRAWARLWGRLPLVDGESFREMVHWRDTSLLWLTEGFILNETAGPRCAEIIEISHRLLEATGAREIDVAGLAAPEATLLSRACTARGILFHGSVPRARPIRDAPPRRMGWPRRLARTLVHPGGSSPPVPPVTVGQGEGAPVLLIGGQQGDTRVLEPLLEAATAELARPGVLVPVSSLRRWKTRRVLRRAAEAEDYLRRCWERLRGAPGLFESYRHRDIGFADLASRDLERILLGHLPTAVRRLEVAIEMLDALGPATVLLSGWPRDDRRTLLTACAVAGVPAAVVHLGAVRSEELDREDGGPRAKATFAWTLGANLGPVLARLGEAARARVERE